MTNPTASACTTTYGAAGTLPTTLAAKCDATTCSGFTTDITTLKAWLLNNMVSQLGLHTEGFFFVTSKNIKVVKPSQNRYHVLSVCNPN